MLVYCGNKIIADKVKTADTFFPRLKGLMGRRLKKGEGLLLYNCPQIHCFFMKIPIDAVYLDRDYKVLGVETLKPWSLGRRFENTAHVLELNADSASVSPGDKLGISELELLGGNKNGK